MVTLRPTLDKNGLIFTSCMLEIHVDVDVGFLDDRKVGLVDGWIFNKSLMIKMEEMLFGM